MLKLVTYMNRLLKKANIDVADNIEITQTSAVVEVKGKNSRLQKFIEGELGEFFRLFPLLGSLCNDLFSKLFFLFRPPPEAPRERETFRYHSSV